MKKHTFLKGNLDELFEYYRSPSELGSKIDIEECLSGRRKNIDPQFRIPSADIGTEIFFDDEELFLRFGNMTLPQQNIFCETVRGAMRKADTHTLRLIVDWGEMTETKADKKKETKVLEIRLVGNDHLEIYLLKKNL